MAAPPMLRNVSHCQFDRNHHDIVAPHYDELVNEPRRVLSDKVFRALASFIPASGESMLDLGAGTGHMTERFGGRFKHALLIDHSKAMLKQAMSKLAALQNTEIRLEQADALEFMAKVQERFDLVACVGFLHHLEPDEMRAVLIDVRRVLSAQGRVVVAEPVRSLKPEPMLIRWWNAATAPKVRRYLALAPPPHDEIFLGLDRMREIVRDAGLVVAYERRAWEIFTRFGGGALDKLAITVLDRIFGKYGEIWFAVLQAA